MWGELLAKDGWREVAEGFSRFVRSRLHVTTDTPIFLQLDYEQVPDARNRVTLLDETDAWDRPKARIDWEVRERDHEIIEKTTKRFFELWPAGRSGIPELAPLRRGAEATKPHDAYHPVGTTRMGMDRDAVVTPELQVRGTENLFVLSTAVFPTAGTANPTFSMLCLGHALAQKLAQEFSR